MNLLLKKAFVSDFTKSEFQIKDIRIKNNIISDVDDDLESKQDDKEFFLEGKYIVPSYIDASTNIGMLDVGESLSKIDSDDISIDDMSMLKTINAINPFDKYFEKASKNGIGLVVVNSGDKNVIGAQGCAIHTQNVDLKERIFRECCNLKINMGNDTKKWKYNLTNSPLSRMGIANIINVKLETLLKSDSRLATALKEKTIPLVIRANKAQDIIKAIELKEKYKINIIVDGASEAKLVISELRQSSTPVIVTSVLRIDTSEEKRLFDVNIVKSLIENEILVAISTHHPDTIVSLLPVSASILMSLDVDYFDALKTITLNPATMLGINEFGSIEVGKHANLNIYDSNPKSIYARIEKVINNGQVYNNDAITYPYIIG